MVFSRIIGSGQLYIGQVVPFLRFENISTILEKKKIQRRWILGIEVLRNIRQLRPYI